MSNAPPKKRPWFQLHLSTCVVLLVVAGILMALNFTDWIKIEAGPSSRFYEDTMSDKEISVYFSGNGWPVRINEKVLPFGSSTVFGIALAIDLAFALSLLGLTALACKFFIRRRERMG